MIALKFGDEDAFHRLETKIMSNNALLDDIVWFQQLIDARVQQIFAYSPEDLFVIEPTQRWQQPQESTSLYTICSICGEQVLANRCVERRERVLCLPCFQKEVPGCSHYGMQ